MDSRKIVLKETAIVAIGEIVCSGIMIGVFAAFGKLNTAVLLSALAGSFLMTANYFFMAIIASVAADRAEKGQIEQGKKMVSISSVVRLVLLGLLLVAGIKLGGNVVALALPLAFVRPTLLLAEFFRKKVD